MLTLFGILILLFGIVTNHAAIPSPLLVVESDANNNTFIVQYNWDTDGNFFRLPLVKSAITYVNSATFSSSRQTLFLLLDDYDKGYQTLLRYDLRHGKLNTYKVRSYGPLDSAAYFEETDQLWVLLRSDDSLFSGQLEEWGENEYFLMITFSIPRPHYIMGFTYWDQKLFFALGDIQFWTWELERKKVVIENGFLGDGLAYNHIDKHVYYTVANHLCTFNPITREGHDYRIQWPYETKHLYDRSASMIDGKYVSTVSLETIGTVLSIATPGGSNFYQKIENRAVWVWKWPDYLTVNQ